MAVISVVSHCRETAMQLETALRGRGHVISAVSDSELKDARRSHGQPQQLETGLFVVDIDCDPAMAAGRIREISEEPSTGLIPVLVACSAEFETELARACAYGATGLLRKLFRTVETVPDTERALVAASPAK